MARADVVPGPGLARGLVSGTSPGPSFEHGGAINYHLRPVYNQP